jgi:hypothetical protein
MQWDVEGRRYAEVDEVSSLPVFDEDLKHVLQLRRR